MNEIVSKSRLKPAGLLGGLLFLSLFLFSPAPEGLSTEGWRVLVVALFMAIWWITEAVPIPVTAITPVVAFPLLGLGGVDDAASGFSDSAITLTLGGFILGVALQHWHLHKRIALYTIRMIGTSPNRVIAGFMIATAFLSMWITNTATTVMMLPIALSVVTLLMEQNPGDEKARQNFGIAMMISLAYAATIGGGMTLVGTSTNVMFKGYFSQVYDLDIRFIDWMMVGVPLGICMLIISWLLLTRILYPCSMAHGEGVDDLINNEIKGLGPMSSGERRTLSVFALTAGLWMTGDWISEAFSIPLPDASIAIFGAMLLFIISAGDEPGRKLLTWNETRDVPWGILLLLGGGITLASYLNEYGVAEWMGHKVGGIGELSTFELTLLITIAIIFLSELMSNVATLTAFLPVIVSVALTFGENPLALAVPAAMAASCAFMLPIGTPPNAIVFGSGLIRIAHMARSGIWLNMIAIVMINIVCYLLLPSVFDVIYGEVPEWALSANENAGPISH